MTLTKYHGFEIPVCTLCRVNNTRPFRWGTYHLNLSKPLEVVQCNLCGLHFLAPRPDQTLRLAMMSGEIPKVLKGYDSKTANYATRTGGRSLKFTRSLAQIEQLWYESKMHPYPTLLDIGASSGFFISLARERGWQAEGLEPSKEGCLAALSNGMNLAQGMAEKMPIKDSMFDIAHSHHVFEHLEDPLLATQEAWRVLKAGGLLCVEVPNQMNNIMIQRDIVFRRVPQRRRNIRSIHHLWFFSKQSIEALLLKAGFTNIYITSSYSWGLPEKWRGIFSGLTRVIGKWWGGGDLITAYGWKPNR